MNMHESVRKFCATIGENPLLVQGAGGNVSWKEDATLWIKASGTWLAEAMTDEIFVQVDIFHQTHIDITVLYLGLACLQAVGGVEGNFDFRPLGHPVVDDHIGSQCQR